ncbi:MAG: MFS transporter [Syntrophaceae bacterium]|nr:MFS transporter [Syntrophaceae bacterium]
MQSVELKSNLAKRRFYYGWVIVGLSMVSMAFWFGTRTTFSVFFVALIDHFHWGRAEAAGAQSIAMIAYMIMAPVIGTLVDRIGPRKVIVPGILLTGLGFLLCTQIRTLFQFYLFFGILVGIGVTCLSIAPFTVILSHWFERKRGTANGLAAVGIGLGIFILVPLIQYLISTRGWPSAFFIFSLLTFAIPLPLNAIFLKHRPQEMGLLVDGDLPTRSSEVGLRDSQNQKGASSPLFHGDKELGEIIKTAQFWYAILYPSLTTLGVYIIIVHHVRYLVDLGVDKIWAASLFAVIGALSAGFRLFWGWFSDHMGREITFTMGGICFSSGILFLLLFQYFHAMMLLYLFALFFGAGWGVTAPMFMSITADLFKGKHFGLIYGMLEGVIGLGAALGAWVPGYIYDQSQNYFWAFMIALILNLISILLVWLAAPRKSRRSHPFV